MLYRWARFTAKLDVSDLRFERTTKSINCELSVGDRGQLPQASNLTTSDLVDHNFQKGGDVIDFFL
jgi:hypothetical protein